ncbi:exported hypothetical protein [Rhodospirillaceae bacterium LM-1]|nr:exported hypothetical protein [Rhodospirillaceae bacterium LM-1]
MQRLFLLALAAFCFACHSPVLAQVGQSQAQKATSTTLSGKPMPQFPKTLLYTSEESDKIESFLTELPKAFTDADGKPKVLQDAPQDDAKPNIYLSALVYQGEKDWSAWINGMRFRPDTVEEGIRPVRATSRWIELDVDSKAGPSIRVRLSPNQTYLTEDDKVVDGIFP